MSVLYNTIMKIHQVITFTLVTLIVSSLFAAGVNAQKPNDFTAQKPKIEFCEECQKKIEEHRAEMQTKRPDLKKGKRLMKRDPRQEIPRRHRSRQ